MKRPGWVSSLLLLGALLAPLGIAVHLISEFAGLGDADHAVAFSARHLYLAILAVASLVYFAHRIGITATPAERRRRAALLIASLPARGPRLFAASFVAQIAFFYLSQFGEGCPLCGGDLAIGIAAALIASIAGALLVALFRTRFLELAIAFVALAAARTGAPACTFARNRAHGTTRRVTGLAALVRPNRPPPWFPSPA